MDWPSPYLTIRQTAELLALSTRTIPRYIAERKVKAYRVAGEKVIRIKREDVDDLVKPLGAPGQAGRQARVESNGSTKRGGGQLWHGWLMSPKTSGPKTVCS